jgi:hydrogen peroxide-dependent heme synthase
MPIQYPYESHPSRNSPGCAAQLPAVPLTLEGYATLHQMMRFRWTAWRSTLAEDARREIAAEAATVLTRDGSKRQWPVRALLAARAQRRPHADPLSREFRPAQSGRARPGAASTPVTSFEPTTSYLSVIELGLYESSLKTYKALAERGVEPHSEEWKKGIAETIARQKEAMKPRLFPAMPPNRYVCFYPMDRRRGEDKNWYTLPMEERQRQMNEHGLVGRRYAGEVKQIITGSIGFDDWEWGVDLFADDPLVFKKLIYEMRFDHVSAVYALFGSFYIGLRCPANRLYDLLEGNLPEHA